MAFRTVREIRGLRECEIINQLNFFKKMKNFIYNNKISKSDIEKIANWRKSREKIEILFPKDFTIEKEIVTSMKLDISGRWNIFISVGPKLISLPKIIKFSYKKNRIELKKSISSTFIEGSSPEKAEKLFDFLKSINLT